jgi:hypothetical protein
MQAERLKILQSLLEEEPDEPFHWYALAMEYMRTDQRRACELLQEVVRRFPTYLASYYQLASIQLAMEFYVDAKITTEAGIRLAVDLHNAKAQKELKALLQQILDEMMFDE